MPLLHLVEQLIAEAGCGLGHFVFNLLGLRNICDGRGPRAVRNVLKELLRSAPIERIALHLSHGYRFGHRCIRCQCFAGDPGLRLLLLLLRLSLLDGHILQEVTLKFLLEMLEAFTGRRYHIRLLRCGNLLALDWYLLLLLVPAHMLPDVTRTDR